MNFSIGCLFSLPRFFFNSFSFFCNSSSIVPRDRELSLKIRDRKRGSRANIFFQNFPQRKKKESRTMMVVRGKIARFHLFFFCFFLSFSTNLEIFFKFAKIVARTRANVNEDRRDPRNTLPFSQQPHVYHRIRDCLSDNYYYYYGCVSLTSFLHVYLSIFFFFLSRFSYYFFFLTRLDNSRV